MICNSREVIVRKLVNKDKTVDIFPDKLNWEMIFSIAYLHR